MQDEREIQKINQFLCWILTFEPKESTDKDALQKYYDKESIRSDNLYQLYAYLTNLEALGEENCHCDGILLYPTVEKELDYKYDIKGHRVFIKTINLNQDWKQIHKDLLEIIN